MKPIKAFLTLLLLISAASICLAQQKTKPLAEANPESKALFNEIAHMDSVLFKAFNGRDFEKIQDLFTKDLEFYHDKGGLTGYAENMESFKKIFTGDWKVRRELVAGSMEVYPVKDHGAMQIGIHRFFETGKDGIEHPTSTPKFVHIWQKKDGQWKISRVISYAH